MGVHSRREWLCYLISPSLFQPLVFLIKKKRKEKRKIMFNIKEDPVYILLDNAHLLDDHEYK